MWTVSKGSLCHCKPFHSHPKTGKMWMKQRPGQQQHPNETHSVTGCCISSVLTSRPCPTNPAQSRNSYSFQDLSRWQWILCPNLTDATESSFKEFLLIHEDSKNKRLIVNEDSYTSLYLFREPWLMWHKRSYRHISTWAPATGKGRKGAQGPCVAATGLLFLVPPVAAVGAIVLKDWDSLTMADVSFRDRNQTGIRIHSLAAVEWILKVTR